MRQPILFLYASCEDKNPLRRGGVVNSVVCIRKRDLKLCCLGK